MSEHKDIEDEGQTVTVKELPEKHPKRQKNRKEPEKPSTGDTPSHKTTDSPKRVTAHIAEFAILLGISAAGLCVYCL